MPFTPVSGIIRTFASAPASPSPAPSPPAQAASEAPNSFVGGGHVRASLADQARAKEAALPAEIAQEITDLRGAKSVKEMRAALLVATARLPELRERVETLVAERVAYLRGGAPDGAAAVDEKLAVWGRRVEAYDLLITEFEADIPKQERAEAEALARLRERAKAHLAEREAAAEKILALRPAVIDFANTVRAYDAADQKVTALAREIEKGGFRPDETGLDFSLPLVTGWPAARPAMEPPHVPGDIVRGLRVPGIAARGEERPDWLYHPR